MGEHHLTGHLLDHFDIDQIALADSGAALSGFVPFAGRNQQLGPVRKRRALDRFDLMYGTAAVLQERAVGMARDAQSAQVLCPVDMAFFKRRRRKTHVGGDAYNVFLSQINEALFLAAFRAAGLAFEADVQLAAF